MHEEKGWSKVENIKRESNYLRGNIREELAQPSPAFAEETANVLKHHGIYQQDDRDYRVRSSQGGGPDQRRWIMMVRVKIPGGRLTTLQWLALLEFADRFGNGTLRITNRQDIQFHGVPKAYLRDLMAGLNRVGLTTLGACGDVVRNVVSCPAPLEDGGIRDELYRQAQRLTEHFLPRSQAYKEVWTEPTGADSAPAHLPGNDLGDEEPIYGRNYLPRKFKIALTLAEDNCVDALTNDLAFEAIVESGSIAAYHVLAGGGLGMSPGDASTFPALAQPLATVAPGELLPVAEAVVKVFRDFGNRNNRRRARLKYLIADWGLEKFREVVEEYLGRPLGPPREFLPVGIDTHLGWFRQRGGGWFYGLFVENGRVCDRSEIRLKTALKVIAERLRPGIRLTPLMDILLTELSENQRSELEHILADHGVSRSEERSPLRAHSGACVGLPTCGLAITESERLLPRILDQLETVCRHLGLQDLPLCVHMTGCPNGCGRPYNAEIGLVGRGKDKYAIYLGGSPAGSRLGYLWERLTPAEQIVPALVPLLGAFAQHRQDGEYFGDFCARMGPEALRQLTGGSAPVLGETPS